MTDPREREDPAPDRGTTSDPNQENRQPGGNRGPRPRDTSQGKDDKPGA